ncbi:hypothetical protein A8709_27575 [Paenibacillus pectinilyticus]|uniref:Uncharacterized protein n=1 Tax=Paenibacillus pectinilyticus TaxID=512399 RepID=A0A1C0ZU58_9BACL|nr:hypothetical protein [Paenibacillus pectinilyticus]OCT11639.1 hypothetical protein A8709_27575 [Paenibacillus pectinilyticus]
MWVMVKMVNVLLAVVACVAFLLIAYQADPPSAVHNPNPMQQNQEQFTRMQPPYYANSNK